jgi:hypothetical protein
VHASGFIHARFLLKREEYLTGISSGLRVSSRDVADAIARQWNIAETHPEIRLSGKVRILEQLKGYFQLEYDRRCRRHPFYQEAGFGGRLILGAVDFLHEQLNSIRAPKRTTPTRLGYTRNYPTR